MSLTTCGPIEITLHTTNLWLEDLMEELGWKDRDQAYQALRVVLHALRDRLPEEALAALAAQLPLLIRGIYYEGWDPSGKPLNEPQKEDFLAQIAAAYRNNPEVDPERVAWAVFKVLKRYATSGDIRDMGQILPPEIRALWPDSEEIHAHKHVMSNAAAEDPSMRRSRADLERLTLPLNELTVRIEKAVRQAIQALIERRPKAELAQVAVDVNDAIDSEKVQIEEECLKLLAGSEPVTSDLRRVAAVLKINTHLEGIADLAVKTAELAIVLAGASREVPIPERLRVMTCSALRMARDSIDAFIRSDSGLARTTCASDEIYRLDREVIEDLQAMIRADPDRLEAGFHLFSVMQHLERIAGHATKIAEYVVCLGGNPGGNPGRVALGVAPQSSHRAGRADFPHPVRHVVAPLSLTRPSGCAVTRLRGSVSSAWFQPLATTRRPLRSTGSGRARSPASALL